MNSAPIPGPVGKKHRPCPALQATISAADCGSQRGSRLNCPADCPFFPFGTAAYDLWLKVDAGWLKQTLNRVLNVRGRPALEAAVKAHQVPLADQNFALEAALNRGLHHLLFLERGPAGQTVAEGWEAEGWSGLNNDERVMMQYRRATRPTVVEVTRVLDDQALHCVDLLAPERPAFPVFDRAAASQTVRFSRLLTWLTDYPNFARLGLPAIQIPPHLWPAWQERFQGELAQAKTTTPDLDAKTFLAMHWKRFAELVGELATQHRERMVENLDLNQCLASYRLTAPVAEVEAAIRTKPEFRAGEALEEGNFAKPLARFDWLRMGESAALEKELGGSVHLDAAVDGVGTVGTLRIYPEHLVVETFSKRKHAFARRMVEQHFGALAKFEEESVVNLAQVVEQRSRQNQLVAAARSAVFEGTVPPPESPTPAPESAESPEAEQRAHEQHYQQFLDTPLTELDGKPPRAAAGDALLRPRLAELLKTHVHNLALHNRRTATTLSLDGVLDELGFPELK